ncbi:uncharacterized mitochondrial protein AtMg00810-like [Cryptomeria japonica]|uniref:uncharacterized mitochondrial protein AtMg00810-like n=1 Tax=Cryptomeria japonica TaxID=3369 RepID=UPI0027DA512F|nr:uncharacterized mitochondrial protein AtMg00810-like [Cryptomeria japonica]
MLQDVEEDTPVGLDKAPKSVEADSTNKKDDASSKVVTPPKTPSKVVIKNHPQSQIIGDKDVGVLTRRRAKSDEQAQMVEHYYLVTDFEPKTIFDALVDDYWLNPEGFVSADKPDHVCRLRKALYGLKQAPRSWYSKLDAHLTANGFTRGGVDSNLYVKVEGNDILVVEVYVDDIIFGCNNDSVSKKFSKIMESEFEMSMLGELTFFLGFQVIQLEQGIFMSQTKYAKEMLKKFNMTDCKFVSTPMETSCKLTKSDDSPKINQSKYRSMIGSLLYLTTSRPDLMHAVCLVSLFQSAPKQSHLNVVKRIFKYIKGTLDYGLWYPQNNDFNLVGFTDADWVGCMDDRKIMSGVAFFLEDCLVAWHNKKQECVTLSTAKSEYIAETACCTQLI